MIYTRNIGDAEVTNIIEYVGPTHVPKVLYPELDMADLEQQLHWLAPNQYVPHMERFIVAMQIWVVKKGDNVIIVDTGVGNMKERPKVKRMHHLNSLTLEWLEAAGASREKVTHVINTHLHADHVGWNTTLEDGKWVPTFPNAEYLVPRRDYDLRRQGYDDGNVNMMAGSFEDSLIPVLEAGQLGFIDNQEVVADYLRVEPLPGHTPGMVGLSLKDGDEEGIFCADVMHNPIQIALPTLNTSVDELKDLAPVTRVAFLEDAARRNALIMPCHFGFPHCGYVRGDRESGFSFEPEAR
jgi:glyoxylase-like metal-dependent hydrolase (beta-lactamase superfamily II)